MLFRLVSRSPTSTDLDSHNKTRVALANLQGNICNHRVDNHNFPALVMVIGSACLLIS